MRVPALLGRLAERFDPELIVIACNTASTIALDAVRSGAGPADRRHGSGDQPAAERSKTRVIGVLGTPATVRQPYVDRLPSEFAADCTVIRHGSAELVGLAEPSSAASRPTGTPTAILRGLLSPAGGDRIDTVVLACTHFPLVEAELEAAAPRPLAFVDGKEGIARPHRLAAARNELGGRARRRDRVSSPAAIPTWRPIGGVGGLRPDPYREAPGARP